MPEERVGSVGEEALKLLRALSDHGPTVADQVPPRSEHVCSTGWCPLCQVVGLAKEHPEAVAQIAESAMTFARSVRDVVVEHAVQRREEPS